MELGYERLTAYLSGRYTRLYGWKDVNGTALAQSGKHLTFPPSGKIYSTQGKGTGSSQGTRACEAYRRHVLEPLRSDLAAMPGVGRQSVEVQEQVIAFLRAGINPNTIHKRLKVGRSSIYRMKRSLEQHGTAYSPAEEYKKNGRPKVLTTEQELEICDWLRNKVNRDKFLDDMVWFIHERYNMVCSTTTCSKLKRKWLKVLEAEERGDVLHPTDAAEQVRLEAQEAGRRISRTRPPPSDDVLTETSAGEQYARPSDLVVTSNIHADLHGELTSAALQAV